MCTTTKTPPLHFVYNASAHHDTDVHTGSSLACCHSNVHFNWACSHNTEGSAHVQKPLGSAMQKTIPFEDSYATAVKVGAGYRNNVWITLT